MILSIVCAPLMAAVSAGGAVADPPNMPCLLCRAAGRQLRSRRPCRTPFAHLLGQQIGILLVRLLKCAKLLMRRGAMRSLITHSGSPPALSLPTKIRSNDIGRLPLLSRRPLLNSILQRIAWRWRLPAGHKA